MKSIDRLREYVTGPARCGISLICEKIILKELDSIEREVGEMQRALTIDTQPMTDENMAEHGWVRLPVDAEGVPIHVGDVMEWPDCSTAEVVGIGDGTFFYVEEDEYAAEWTAASDMALFCNLFDSIATECGCAMVYSHHFSKGASSKYTNAADRASGSGVFARDPDAILSMSELPTDEGKVATYREVRPGSGTPTGWRISATLREFPTPPETDIWFDWPLHVPDEGRVLASVSDRGEQGVGKGQCRKEDSRLVLDDQWQLELSVSNDNAVSKEDLMAVTGYSESKIDKAVLESDALMRATVLTPDGSKVKVVAEKDVERIVFGGISYVPQRTDAGTIRKRGAGSEWLPIGTQMTNQILDTKPPYRGNI